MKQLPLLEKDAVQHQACKEKWESYPFDLALFHGGQLISLGVYGQKMSF